MPDGCVASTPTDSSTSSWSVSPGCDPGRPIARRLGDERQQHTEGKERGNRRGDGIGRHPMAGVQRRPHGITEGAAYADRPHPPGEQPRLRPRGGLGGGGGGGGGGGLGAEQRE